MFISNIELIADAQLSQWYYTNKQNSQIGFNIFLQQFSNFSNWFQYFPSAVLYQNQKYEVKGTDL